MQKGVLVDHEGFFLGAFQWEDDENAPDLAVSPRVGERVVRLDDRRVFLTMPEALDPPSEKARWDFQAKAWRQPEARYWIVDDRGTPVGGGLYHKSRPPRVPAGTALVTEAPGNTNGRRMIWNGTAWQAPRRVIHVDGDGVVINIVNENPRDDQPDVATPAGCSRYTEDNWPLNADGNPAQRGDTIV